MPTLMMEAESSFKTSVNIYQITLCYITDDSHLQIRRRENLEFHLINTITVPRFYGQNLMCCF
jgi:hypothetical protein